MSGRGITRRDFFGAGAAGAAGLWLAGCAGRGRGAGGGAGPLVYVGTYTEPGGRPEGVYAFRAAPGGWEPLGAHDAGPNPSFLAAHPRGGVLYAVNEVEQYAGLPSGAVRALRVGPGGALAPLGDARASGGGAPCYVSVDAAARRLLVANYAGGSVARLALGADGAPAAPRVRMHAGRGPNAARQGAPHAHCFLPDPTGRWGVAADLGTDQLLVYDVAGEGLPPVDGARLRPGAGPRHLAFAPGGRVLYAVGELDRTLNTFRFDPATGALAPAGTVALADESAPPAGERTAAHVAVAASGRVVYASVRGDDVLVVLAADPATGALAVVQRVPTGGRWPRHFALAPDGRTLHVANQRSDAVVEFAVDPATGRLAPTGRRVAVPRPVCVCWMPAA